MHAQVAFSALLPALGDGVLPLLPRDMQFLRYS